MVDHAAGDAPKGEADELPLEPEIYFLHLALVVAQRREARVERTVKPLGITVAGFRALRVCNRFGPTTMGELAEYTLTDRTTLTRVVDDLVKAGLIVRTKSAGDRRKVMLELTAAGRRLYQRAAGAVSRDLMELMRDLPQDDLMAAIRVQQAVTGRLAESEAQLERLLWRTRAPDAIPTRQRRLT
jgi:DNA-binding MarR family transcriptional regulator